MISPDAQLALAYSPPELRADFATLLHFDAILGQAFRATQETRLIEIRLAWWRDQLARPTAGEPLVIALSTLIRRYDVTFEMLDAIIDGWSVLLDDPPYSNAQLEDYARLRGGGLFAIAARMAGEQAGGEAGQEWALTDFARHCGHRATAKYAMALAQDCLRDQPSKNLPKSLRSFAILTRFAQSDCLRPLDQQRRAGSPYRIIQAIGFTFFGR